MFMHKCVGALLVAVAHLLVELGHLGHVLAGLEVREGAA